MLTYTLSELLFYLMFYSFLGWCVEVIICAVQKKVFLNKGFLNLPVVLSYGVCCLILFYILPALQSHLILQWIVAFIVFHVIWQFSEIVLFRLFHLKEEEFFNLPTLTFKSQMLFEVCASTLLLAVILLLHPFTYTLVRMIPNFIIDSFSFISTLFIIFDFFITCTSLHFIKTFKIAKSTRKFTQKLTDKICHKVYLRLKKSYPQLELSNHTSQKFTFAKGLGFDKIVWIFLISSFLGALIEMCFCRFMDGIWMNRSSLLYGSFSVVWGIGAVVLTLALKPIKKRNKITLFLTGFLLGGIYEYLCSVFTEIVFGTVFWDYSHMPFHIGGRTNLLYCIFWGILGVIWVCFVLPPLEKTIEMIPPLYGKIITWIIVLFFVLDSALTCFAMIRYNTRATQPIPANKIEEFFDYHFDDNWMQERWPNMVTI